MQSPNLSQPPKALFLDLDETLLADNESFTRSIHAVCEDLARDIPGLTFEGLEELYRMHSEAYWLEVAPDVMSGRMSGTAVRQGHVRSPRRDDRPAPRHRSIHKRHLPSRGAVPRRNSLLSFRPRHLPRQCD